MTSTFSRASDAPSQNAEQLTNSKPDFNVVSLLKEHPSRASDMRTTGISAPDKLDFGSVHQLYGSHDDFHHHRDGDHYDRGHDGGGEGGRNSVKDDSSLPVELVDAMDEIKRAQDAFKNGDPERAQEWLRHANKNLRALTGDNSNDGEQCGGGHGEQPEHEPGGAGSEGGSEGGQEGSEGGYEGGSEGGHEGGSEGGTEQPQPSDQQIQLQQMIATLAQALQALASGDMQQFQQLLSGLLAQVNQMMPPENGSSDEPGIHGPGGGLVDTDPYGDGNINPVTGLPNPFSGLPNPFTGLPGLPELPELPGLPHFSNGGSNSDNGFQLPGLPSIQLPGFPNLNGSGDNTVGIQLPGIPAIELPGLPSIQLPGLPNFSGNDSGSIGIPGLPNLPGLPELPNLPGLPKLPGLPGLSGGGSDNHSGGLPKLPGLPDLGDIFDIF